MSEPEGTSSSGPSPRKLREHGLFLLSRSTEKLTSFCAEADPNMALSSIQALGKIGDPASVDPLLSLLENGPHAEEAVLALAHIAAPGINERLRQGLRGAVPGLAAAIASVLWQDSGPEGLACLAELAKSPYPQVRIKAVESLGRIGLDEAMAHLEEALEDEEEEVVIASLKAMQQLGFSDLKHSLEVLTPRFESAGNKVRATIADVFMGHTDSSLTPFVKKALRDEDARVRANAVEVLAAMDIPDQRKQALLKPLIIDGQHNRVLANVAIALGEIDERAVMQILSGLLNSPEKWERASAVYAARHIRNDRISGWLTTIFTSEHDPDVLRNVIESLSYFTGEEVLSCFVKALSHKNPIVRRGAVRSLGRMGDATAEEHLVNLLEREEDQEVISEALTALGKISDVSRIPLVAGYLQHTDLRVQANAIEALLGIGTIEIIPYVEPFLNSSDNRVKANAAIALWNSGSLDVVDHLEAMLDSPNLKQKSSSVYAIGEIGASLRDLANLERYLLLASALEEDMNTRARSGPASSTGASGIVEVAEMPPFPVEVLDQAHRMQGTGDPEGALDLLETELNKGENPYLRFLSAEIHRRRGEVEDAISDYRTRGAGNRPFLNVQISLASLCNKSGDIPGSLKQYFAALETQLSLLGEVLDLGRAMLDEGRVGDASLLLKKLVSRFPLDSRLHKEVGLDFLKNKSFQAAYQHLTLAYLIEPGSTDILFPLALACLRTGHEGPARWLLERLIDKLPEGDPRIERSKGLLAHLDSGNP